MSNFSDYLKDILEDRQKHQPKYSVRSFANDLGVGKTTIAEILNGTRVPSEKNLHTIIDNIAQTDREKEDLTEKFLKASSQKRLKFKVLEEVEFHPISDWEYFAILNLCKLKDNQASAQWISSHLSIPLNRAQECLDNLIKTKYLAISNEKLVRLSNPISSQTDISDAQIKKHHSQSLNLAEEALYNTPTEVREYIAGTIAISEEDIPKAKEELFELYRNFAKKYDKSSNADAVYKINMQLFPCQNF